MSVDSGMPDQPVSASVQPSVRRRADSEHALHLLPLLDGTSNSQGYAVNGSAHTHAMYFPNGTASVDQGEPGKGNGRAGREQTGGNREVERSRPQKAVVAGIRAQAIPPQQQPHMPSHNLGARQNPRKTDADPRIAVRRAQQPEHIAVKARMLVPEPSPAKRVFPPRELVPSYLRDVDEGGRRNLYRDYDYDSEEADEITTRLNLARAHVEGYGEGLNEAHGYSTRGGYTSAQLGGYTITASQDRYAAPARDVVAPTADAATPASFTSHRNLAGYFMGIDPDTYSDDTPRQMHSELETPVPSQNWLATLPNSGRSAVERVTHYPTENVSPTSYAPVGRDAAADRTHTGRSSITSLENNSRWSDSIPSSQGSLSTIGLPNTVSRGGVRGQGSVTMTTPTFPRELESDSDRDGPSPLSQSRTSRFEGFQHQHPTHPSALTPGHPRGYMSDDERPRYSRTYSQPQVPVAEDFYRRGPVSDNLRMQLRQRQSLSQSSGLDSNTPPPSAGHRAQTQAIDNALALSFHNSSSLASFHARRQSPEQIRAPAPRMSGPTVLTSMWR